MARTDPRDIITPDAFTVAPHLLGLPLASPTRRAVALGIDLLLLAFLVNVGGSVLFGMAVAWVFFRAALRREGVRRLPPPVRWTFGVLGVVVLFAAASSLWGRMFGGDDEEETRDTAAELRTAGRVLGGERGEIGSALLATADLIALQGAESEEEAYRLAKGSAERLRGSGATAEEVRGALQGYADDSDEAVVKQGILRALEELGGALPPPPSPDSLARVYAAALSGGDTAAAAAIRPQLGTLLAADTLRAVREEMLAARAQASELREENEELEGALEEARKDVGLVDTLVRWADELGIGFGWAGLYFTGFLVLWRGQTPGKRMMGVRVLRLDGGAITWWTSFERFGGYVAGFATGLLDFFLIVRDRNRQTLHDKIVDTVVVRETGSGPVS